MAITGIARNNTMQQDYEKQYHAKEVAYWWFVARRDLIRELLRSTAKDAALLDIGCASGVLIEELSAAGFRSVSGIDISATAVDACRRRGIRGVTRASGDALPFADGSFDIVISSDVLEHIRNESQALNEWRRVLAPGGRMLLFVPAWSFLWSEHDVVNRHIKRYAKAELAAAVTHAGLRITRQSYWNFLLFFPTTVVRLARSCMGTAAQSRHSPRGQLYECGRALNAMLEKILKAENYLLLRGVNFPVGVSVFIEATK